MATVLVGICDDESVALNHVASVIKMEFQMKGIDAHTECFSDPDALIKRFSQKPVLDIIFLDIEMPSINGIELAQKARELTPSTAIVFVTSKDEYVFRSFKVQPFRYIRKQDFAEEIKDCIADLIKIMPENITQNYITLLNGHNLIRLNVADISYIESIGKTVFIHTKEDTIELKHVLSDLEEKLAPYHFFRIHKSYLVNGTYIFSIESREVKLTTGDVLPLSRYRVQEIKQQFQELLLCR